MVAVPLGDHLGLISYQSIDGSFNFREKQILSQISENCSLAFIASYRMATQNSRFIAYCLDLSIHKICNVYIWIRELDKLNSSSISTDDSFDANERETLECSNTLSNTAMSNILYYSNQPPSPCFFNNFGHVIFLSSGDIIDHSHEDIYYYQNGRVNIPACSVSEPRIQQLGRECKLVVYCNETTTAVIDFQGRVEAIFSKEVDGQVFLCTSSKYVRFRNRTLSIETGNQVLGSSLFDAENIIQGVCHIFEAKDYFIAALDDARLIFVNFA